MNHNHRYLKKCDILLIRKIHISNWRKIFLWILLTWRIILNIRYSTIGTISGYTFLLTKLLQILLSVSLIITGWIFNLIQSCCWLTSWVVWLIYRAYMSHYRLCFQSLLHISKYNVNYHHLNWKCICIGNQKIECFHFLGWSTCIRIKGKISSWSCNLSIDWSWFMIYVSSRSYQKHDIEICKFSAPICEEGHD